MLAPRMLLLFQSLMQLIAADDPLFGQDLAQMPALQRHRFLKKGSEILDIIDGDFLH